MPLPHLTSPYKGEETGSAMRWRSYKRKKQRRWILDRVGDDRREQGARYDRARYVDKREDNQRNGAATEEQATETSPATGAVA